MDPGIGIAQEYIARIFGRFERAAPTSSYGRLAVGPYIVDQILRVDGGSIRVESAPGMGARFQVVLPLPPRAAGSSGPLGQRPGSSLTGPAGGEALSQDRQAPRGQRRRSVPPWLQPVVSTMKDGPRPSPENRRGRHPAIVGLHRATGS
ncbi:sensor histidine kinase [Sorangium sp. So ce233]|uniref:sensor histidine kinase n=1 Tax=Sorangium sp. So ce233 TaxID=3133290 RepID=UPI003F62E58F